ncbi:DUF551 domain-containing protein [Salmonella enterica subsp. enterica serovar Newport]|nr:DUF551 domain-containing protein [Salmonella enterica subsp. enterica serovar Newport]EAP1716696.1 DUF551 domain-containing protein [Salmonella enterica]EHK8783015.1 DUF551 domain-containing protein [Salmonella enterica subsp. enterica serovar Bardo]EAB8440021.1 DUF551 domain-containing protein [Salmonella enterica subsp. enterica serovar Newport]EAB9069239.1 DUF551 domain-containing protein [Salmonella enterica subsp. enterica serovar Newport]
MTTNTNNKLTDETLKAWKTEAIISLGETPKDCRDYSHHEAILALVTELQERRKADNQEPAGYHVIKECGKVGCSVATLEEAEKTRDFWNKKWTIRPYFYSAAPAPVVPEEITADGIIGMHECGFVEGWNACRAAMLHGVEQPQNARQNIPDGNSPVIPDGWISCSERMPDNDESKPIAIFTGKCLGQGMFVATYDDDGFFDYWGGMEIIGVTHWMPLPEPPQEVNRG